jgi:signal transduction histidine kinase
MPDQSRRLHWSDVPLPALMLLFGLFGTGPAARNVHQTVPPLGYALVVIAALGLIAWRFRPLWSLTVTSTATLLYLLLGFAYGPIMFAQAFAVLGVSLRLPLRRALASLGTVLVVSAALLTVGALAGHRGWGELLAIAVWLGVPTAVGIAIKTRRDATVQVRSAQARGAASEERLRLAQEVHDVAGHGFAVIAMQAGVALRVLDRDPAAARAALEGIRATSRDALAGLRAEVEALQQGTVAPRHPRSGLDDLPALVERIRGSGLPVTVTDDLSTVEVPAEVGLAVYRITQEALTNVLRHAGPQASAWVTLRTVDSSVALEIRDDGLGGPARAGHGLDGMRTLPLSTPESHS